jgi:serine/threonine-protein kinase
MAPEQAMAQEIGPWTDLYAVGVIAYELLSNRPLFQGKDDMDTLYRVKNMPVIPPSTINPNVPPEIESIIMTALERDPEKRWQRATAMRQALTTETQRLGLIAHNAQVEDWIIQAFQKQFKEESEPSIVISRHTVELSNDTASDAFSSRDSRQTIVRPHGSQPMPAQQPPWRGASETSTDESLDEATIDEQQPVGKLAAQWNTSNTVETVLDRPRLPDWESPHTMQTREVKMPLPEHRPVSVHTVRRSSTRSTSPPPIQSPVSSNAPATAPSAPEVKAPPAVVDGAEVGAVIASLEQRSSVAPSLPRVAARARRGALLLAVLVLIAAGAAAAVVYFALPYFT